MKALFSLFSQPVKIKYYLTIDKLQEIVEKIARNDSLSLAKALEKTGLPDIVLDALMAKEYLAFIGVDE
ncbi:hypothetical protein BH24DEI2_BH24DEI2_20620 [soil metagenome]